MKKILFVTNQLSFGGEAQALYELSQRWSDKIQITIAHFGKQVDYEFPSTVEIISLFNEEVHDKKHFVAYWYKFRQKRFWHDAAEKLASQNFDSTIAFGMVWPFLLVGFGNFRQKIAWYHNDPQHAAFGMIHNRQLFNQAVQQFDTSIAVASHIADKAESEYGVQPQVIANYLTIQKSELPALHRQAQYELVFVGRLEKQKGLSDALVWLQQLESDVHLHIVGTGSLEKQLQKQARHLPVTFWGAQLDTSRFYQGCDALLLPSFYEGLPTVAIEARSFGLPILVRDNTYVSDLPHNGIYQITNANELEAALVIMKKTPPLVWDNDKITAELERLFD